MQRRPIYFTMPLIASVLVYMGACNRKPLDYDLPKFFTRAAMLKSIGDNVLLPMHASFAQETEKLIAAIGNLDAGTDSAKVAAAQAQWRKAVNAWKACELFNLGRIRAEYIQTKVHTWPANETFIDQFVSSADVIDEAYVSYKGSSSKGLAAIEYLLFSESGIGAVVDSLTTSPTAARKRQYMLAAAQHLHTIAKQLDNEWEPAGDNYYANFISANQSGVNGSVNMLVNEMAAMIEAMANTKLGKPMGKQTSVADHTMEESWRSRESLALLQSNLDVLQRTFHGGVDTSALGLDDDLDFVGAKYDAVPLSQKIDEQFGKVKAALDALAPSLTHALQSDPAATENAYQELKALLVLFKVDVVSNLSITLTLNDNDGD